MQKTPTTEEALMTLCKSIEGLSFLQLSHQFHSPIPSQQASGKGWVGLTLEKALGADAKNQALPDFSALGIELKTLPLSPTGKPCESTFITSISLQDMHLQQWETSQCYAKLKRVLWIPIEGDRRIPYEHRRIGEG